MQRSSVELGVVGEADANLASPARATASGTAQVFIAEGLLLPTGLVTAAYLTRHLGPDGYGLFTLAATVVACLSWILPSALGRASIQMVGQAEDWEAAASTLFRVYVVGGFIFAGALAAGAYPLAVVFREAALRDYLLIFSFELFLLGVVHAHRAILVGTGQYGARARATAAHWVARLVLIIGLVEMGLSVAGAILGSTAATAVELAVCRHSVRPRFNHPRRVRAAQFLGRAAPLIAFGICLRVFDRIDLFALKAFGASASVAGYYGAAQNLAIAPALLALSFAPLLLASLTRMQRIQGRVEDARSLAKNALRFSLATVPFAAMVAAGADGIAETIFGAAFAPTAPLLSRLIFASVAQLVVAVGTAVVVAAGYPRWTFVLAGSMLALAFVGLVFAVPRYGALGAATVTLAVATLGAAAAIFAVWCAWSVAPPLTSALRSAAVSVIVYFAASAWAAEGWGLVPMLTVFAIGIPGALLLTGELSAPEREVICSWLRTPWASGGRR